MAVLDTTFLIDLMKGDEAAAQRIDELLERSEPLSIAAIVAVQLFHGVARAKTPELRERQVRMALRAIPTIPLGFDLARFIGLLDGRMAAAGSHVQTADLLVAATALHAGESVVTRDMKDFSGVPGLHVVTY